jgi:hypothetical protein
VPRIFGGFLAVLPTRGNMTLRRLTSWILAFCAPLVAGSTAWAMPHEARTEIEHEIGAPTPPAPGLERAQIRGVPWCGSVREHDPEWWMSVADDFNQYRNNRHSQFRLFHLARVVCSEPGDPLAQRIAAEVLQLWVNETGMAAREAVESLALRADKDGFPAERTALCDAIKAKDDDTYKERNALAMARFQLLGCRRDDPLWMQPEDVEHVGPFIDRGSAARDDLAHLAWVLHRQSKDLEEGVDDAVVGYAVDQFDFHAVSADAAIHQLDAAPFRGSRYARVMVLESLGRAQLATAKIEALVAKRASDPEWKEMLITAPDRGSAAWNAAAERNKAALARSDDFDRKLRDGGDTHGCQAALRPDFLALWKTLKHEDIPALEAAMSDHPLAGLLAKRFARCLMVDGDPYARFVGAVLLQEVSSHVRVIPGPRTAAYYAVLDAKAGHRDRGGDDEDGESRSRSRSGNHRAPRPLGFTDSRSGMISRLTDVFQFDERDHGANQGDFVEGVIKSVGKGKAGVHVVFVKKKRTYRDQVCHETNRIDSQDPRTGKITYRRVCRDNGAKSVEEGPDPVDVPVELAGALQAGRYARFSGIPINGTLHLSSSTPKLPLEVYRGVQKGKDDFEGDSGKHLLALYGFVLE